MAATDRPSGLTALAVIQFVFCALDALGSIGFIVMRLFAGQAVSGGEDDAGALAFASMSWLDTLVVALLAALSALLLLLSGIGYLGRRRLLGRWLGNAYAVVAIGNVAVSLLLLPESLTGGVTLDVIRGLFYPIFLAFLLNVVFRRDLVR